MKSIPSYTIAELAKLSLTTNLQELVERGRPEILSTAYFEYEDAEGTTMGERARILTSLLSADGEDGFSISYMDTECLFASGQNARVEVVFRQLKEAADQYVPERLLVHLGEENLKPHPVIEYIPATGAVLKRRESDLDKLKRQVKEDFDYAVKHWALPPPKPLPTENHTASDFTDEDEQTTKFWQHILTTTSPERIVELVCSSASAAKMQMLPNLLETGGEGTFAAIANYTNSFQQVEETRQARLAAAAP